MTTGKPSRRKVMTTGKPSRRKVMTTSEAARQVMTTRMTTLTTMTTREVTTMSSDSLESDESAAEYDSESHSADETVADLAAQVELLAEENRRLRDEYVRARRTTHRRTALGLFAVGALAVLGALALPQSRDVLFALGATGLFASVLTYYLTPEQFVAAETGERVYAALATTGAELVAELGLRDERIYAPVSGTAAASAGGESSAGPAGDVDDADGERDAGGASAVGRKGGAASPGVRLFVPTRSDFAVPDPDELDSLFVVTDDDRERGVSLSPTGGGLYREFESAMVGTVEEHPVALADQLADALAEGFELVESASADADPERGRATVEVAGSVYGPVDRFDHPVASLFAVGLAATLDRPVSLDVTPAEDGPADYFVTCEWDVEAGASATRT
jgi:hypothetical protein